MKKEVAGALRQLGYAEAEVRGEVFVETTDQTARVRLVCVPGARYKFGNIFVATGPKPSVAVRYIIDQAQGAIRKGDWYSDKALEEAQRRVFKMGVFGAVKVTTGRPDRENAIVPVVVDVREAPFHTIRYGGGIGLDPVRQEYRFIAEYTDRNFLGDLRKLTLRAKVGWAFLPALWNIDQQAPIFDLYSEFEQPRFPGRDFKWISSVDFYKNIEQAYGFIGVRGEDGHRLAAAQQLPDLPLVQHRGGPHHRRHQRAHRERPAAGVWLQPDPGGPGVLRVPLLSRADHRVGQARRQARAAQRVVPLAGDPAGRWHPRRRLQVHAALPRPPRLQVVGPLHPRGQAAHRNPALQRDQPHHRTLLLRRRHLPSRLRQPPALASARDAQQQRDPHQSTGGGVGTPQLNGTYVPVGGDGLWDSSIELRYKIIGPLTVAVFLDAGFVSVGSFDFRDVGPMMQYAIGFGFRYNTIVGPIRLDFAYRLNHGGPLPIINDPAHPVYAPGGTECFGIGTGSPTYAGFPAGRCALTISIGEAY